MYALNIHEPMNHSYLVMNELSCHKSALNPMKSYFSWSSNMFLWFFAMTVGNQLV